MNSKPCYQLSLQSWTVQDQDSRAADNLHKIRTRNQIHLPYPRFVWYDWSFVSPQEYQKFWTFSMHELPPIGSLFAAVENRVKMELILTYSDLFGIYFTVCLWLDMIKGEGAIPGCRTFKQLPNKCGRLQINWKWRFMWLHIWNLEIIARCFGRTLFWDLGSGFVGSKWLSDFSVGWFCQNAVK